MIYGEPGSGRNALTEEKYKALADAFLATGVQINSVIYNDDSAGRLAEELLHYDAILVWVNPVEQGNDRKKLDTLLIQLANKGCFVSAHPELILQMGTKDILYKVRELEFGGDTRLFHSFDDFKKRFFESALSKGTRVLKRYRGNGGDGVFKIDLAGKDQVAVIHAKKGESKKILTVDGFFEMFGGFFSGGDVLIDQEWNDNIRNGMVRCYLTGSKVSGFGYQEVNALYPGKEPGKRYYYSEDCGLFRDLKEIMETKWVSQLLQAASAKKEMLPVIWDADFFINKPNSDNTAEKYTLCEINVSCVSPFPESCIPHMVLEVEKRIG